MVDDWEQADVDEMASKIISKGATKNGKGPAEEEEEDKLEEESKAKKGGAKESQKVK